MNINIEQFLTQAPTVAILIYMMYRAEVRHERVLEYYRQRVERLEAFVMKYLTGDSPGDLNNFLASKPPPPPSP